MSKVRKAKKLRQPNVPGYTGPVVIETAGPTTAESAQLFDYTHIRRDLTRIGVLAGSFIAILVVLSFFIR